jgi:hypothetical protein
MFRLLRVELKVPGEYRDLWLYKGALHVWDREGVLRYVTLDLALRHVQKMHGSAVANLVQTLIFRNDWKVGEQFNSWMRVPAVRSAILGPLMERDLLTLELPEGMFTRSDSEPYDGLVLDTSIYADRLYLATGDGLLESYINPEHLDYAYGLNQQTDFRASRVAVKYGAINVSAESRGLHFAPVRFVGQNDDPGFMRADWRQVADFSLASSFAWRNLLNYTKSSVPSLLRSRIEEHRKEGARFDDASVVGYEPGETDISSMMYAATVESKKVTASRAQDALPARSDFEILGNSDFHLLVNWDDQLLVIDLRVDKRRQLEARPSQKFSKSHLDSANVDEILATYPMSGGVIAELYDRLDIITAKGSFPLAIGESAQVRTFDNSLRHKEAVAVVQESSVSVFGFYVTDDEIISSSAPCGSAPRADCIRRSSERSVPLGAGSPDQP